MVQLEEVDEPVEQPAAAESGEAGEREAEGCGADDSFLDARTPEEEGEALKSQGNAAYARRDFHEAEELYTRALAAVDAEAEDAAATAAEPSLLPQRPPPPLAAAIYFANRAACRLELGRATAAAADCSAALALDGAYVKALLRRAQAYERQGELELLEKAVADLGRVLELEPGNRQAAERLPALQATLEAKREQLKKEMMDTLKGFGNAILGKFGMSLDNFKAEKDPETGSYSIQFVQSPGAPAGSAES